MTESLSIDELYHALGVNLDYYPDVIGYLIEKFGEHYDANKLSEYESRLTIYLAPRPLPEEVGAVIEYEGMRWMFHDDEYWHSSEGRKLDAFEIQSNWRQLL